MNAKDIVKSALKERGVTQTQLANMMGYARAAGINNRLCTNSKDIGCDLFVKMLDAIGYEVVIQPKAQGKRREGSMVLEPSGLPDGRSKKEN